MDASLIASTVADDGLSVAAGTLSSTQTLDEEIEARDTLVSLLLSPSLVPRTIALPIMADQEQGYANHEQKDSRDQLIEALKSQIRMLTDQTVLFKNKSKRYKHQNVFFKNQNEELETLNEKYMNQIVNLQNEMRALKRKREVNESEEVLALRMSRAQNQNKMSPDSGGDNRKPAQVGSPAQNDTPHHDPKDSPNESKFQVRSLLDSSSDISGGDTTYAQIGSNTPAQNVHQLDPSVSPSFGDGNETSIPTPSTAACNNNMH